MTERAEMETNIAIMKAKIASILNDKLSNDPPMKYDAEMSVIGYAMIEYLVDARWLPDNAKSYWWDFLTESLNECVHQSQKRMP